MALLPGSAFIRYSMIEFGVYPVLPGLEIYKDNDFSASVYKLLSDSAVLAMPEDRQTLNDLATQALSGNKDALAQLKHMLSG
jgi:hypothetical protein